MCVDTKLIFSCSTRYLTRSRRSLVRYRVEHEKIKFMLYSVYHINKLMRTFVTIFRRFPYSFRRFPRILQKFPKARRTFPNIFRNYLKITEDFRGRTDHRATNLGDYVTLAMGIFSLVKIACYFHEYNNMLV